MSLFDIYEKSKSRVSLSAEQCLYFKNVLVQKLSLINNNSLLTFEQLYNRLHFFEHKTTIYDFTEKQKLGISLSYRLDNINVSMYVYVNFDDNGVFSSLSYPTMRIVDKNIITLLHLFDSNRDGIALSFNPSELNSDYIIDMSGVFLFDYKFDFKLDLFYYFSDHLITAQHYVRYCNRGTIKLTVDTFDNIEAEYLYVDFVNLLYSGNSYFLNSFVKIPINFSSLKLFKKSRHLFDMILNSNHKEVLLDELKVYEMATY
jgi:hypothetical protein